MKAAVCVRVSPRPKDRVRYSPEIQESKCREWAEQSGAEIVTVIQDILVSGGAADRFDSIFAALEEHPIDTFVVSDLSRWTRDRPSRFWAMKAILEDRGINLVSVDEPWLGTEMPFGDTVTTAKVEANYLERQIIRAKTSAGVKRAWESGKRWGHPWGWSWDPETRRWSQDVELIRGFYQDYVNGMGLVPIARKYGLLPSNVAARAAAASQREIVGQELWEAAQTRRTSRRRKGRLDAKWANIYRGLLRCPFCGWRLHHHSTQWGHYYCEHQYISDHAFRSLSARKWIEPTVRAFLDRMILPDAEVRALEAYQDGREGPAPAEPDVAEIKAQIDRLSETWIKGRISSDRYEKLMAELEAELNTPKVPVTPLSERVEIVRNLGTVDLNTKDREGGQIINELLVALFEEIRIHPDRSVEPILRSEYQHWLQPAAPALAAVS
jgi:DNA invertase Pin-like site-specific DNA recombinase